MDRLDVGGTWTLKRLSDGSSRPMAVPGDILSALVASGEAPDPYYDRNELSLQWVGREDWELSTTVDVPPELARAERVFIDLDVLDTVAEVRLNGRLVGTSANMFRRFRADVAGAVREGANELSVVIRSPEKAACDRAAALPYPVPASVYPVSSPHRNLLRKAQCMGGWDWGPCLMTGGIYDGAALVACGGPRVDYVTADTRRVSGKPGGAGDFEATVTAFVDSPSGGRAVVSFELAGLAARRSVDLPAGQSAVTETLVVKEPGLWWPAGHGPQTLYALRVRVEGDGVAGAGGEASAHELERRVGFRELQVDSSEDADGRAMTLVVNGRKIFAKGANWIPADALPSRCTRERLEDLLRSAALANMNCLRVWGGGRYESDAFYELCDELGLLVWQDCMFSCALYPASPEFLADVEAETRHQVRRLQSHPSLALWCGNNEALGAITWYEESKRSPARYIVDYDRLTEGTVGRVVRELDPGRPWWPSSPSAGPNDYSDNWHADGRGDMHFWSVWHEGKPFSEYLTVRPRFCSEFGFQSLPSSRVVGSFAPDGQRNVSSPAMEHHQRHARGNSLIVDTMLRYFRMPRGFAETLYLSQVQQAMAIKTAVEYWRASRPRCMGALYWQLNDVWPVSSWSSLEYDGGWKLLHYEARRFFAPVLLALYAKDGFAHAVLVNDGTSPVPVKLSLSQNRFSGEALRVEALAAVAAPEASTLVWKKPLAELAAAPDACYLDASLALPDAAPERSVLFLAEPKACDLVGARLEARVERGEGGRPAVRLRAGAPAFFVALEAAGLPGRFADSGFHLAAGEERVVGFEPRGGASVDAAALAAALSVIDLRGSYE